MINVYSPLYGVLAWFTLCVEMVAVASELSLFHDEVADVLSRLEGTRSDTFPDQDNHQGRALTAPAPHWVSSGLWCRSFGVGRRLLRQQEVEFPRRAPFSGIAGEEGEPVSRLARNG